VGAATLPSIDDHSALPGLGEAAEDFDEYAYTLAIQAYVYGFPWLFLTQLRWLCTTAEGAKILAKISDSSLGFPVPMNAFWHSTQLMSPSYNSTGTPNTDTLYSMAWCDLGREPLILSVPAVKDRYYCIELSGIDSDTYGYVGTRSTGTDPAHYLLAGPGWAGELPQVPGKPVLDVLPRAFYPSILLLGRTGVNNYTRPELAIAKRTQEQYTLTPLSTWLDPSVSVAPPKAQTPVGFNDQTPAGTWLTMNRAMAENLPGMPPGIPQAELLQLFSRIGVGPQQDPRSQSPQVTRALALAARNGLGVLEQALGSRGTIVNGWSYPPLDFGKAGQSGDYLTRAALQAMAGITAHWTIEAVYLNTNEDSAGDPLDGASSYRISFAENTFPPFEASAFGFWSITLYNSSFALVSGSEHYTINSWAPRYSARDEENGMTILLQSSRPEGMEAGSYWLQSPSAEEGDGGRFYMVLRVYVPAPSVATTQTWQPPEVAKVDS